MTMNTDINKPSDNKNCKNTHIYPLVSEVLLLRRCSVSLIYPEMEREAEEDCVRTLTCLGVQYGWKKL